MTLAGTALTPSNEFYSDIERSRLDPNLWVIGRWANTCTVTGDATGGYARIRLAVLPSAPVYPYLPKLKAWWCFTGINIKTTDSAQKFDIGCSSEFPVVGEDAVSTANSIGGVLVQGGSGLFVLPDISSIYNWIMLAVPDNDPGGLWSTYFESNVNTKIYYVQASGLLMKTKSQLIDEGLWDSMRHKPEVSWFKGVGG